MKKKLKVMVRPKCSDCKYRTIDEKWGYSKCRLGDRMPGIKFGFDGNERYTYCSAFAKK